MQINPCFLFSQKDNHYNECCFCGLSLRDPVRLHLHQMAVPIIRNCSSCKLTFSDFNDLNHHSCAKVNFSHCQVLFGLNYLLADFPGKVHIFWEGHKFFRNLHQLFVLCTYCQSNDWWRFRKILWPSQNIWTLKQSI